MDRLASSDRASEAGLVRGLGRLTLPAGAGAVLTVVSAGRASAHVKWFCAFDIAGQPRGLEQVLCSDFETLSGLAILGLMLCTLLGYSSLSPRLIAILDRITAPVRANPAGVIRLALGFFLVSLWNIGGIILTPELKTGAAWIPWLQLAMAAMLIWTRTLPLAALGLVFLYGKAISEYGAFHLADYPIFLGLAGYLLVIGTGRAPFGIRPTEILRYALAVTMMWASIEKWAYPQWSEALLVAHPHMMLGVEPDLYMQAAGKVEFGLAFALLWTPVVSRLAAIALGTIMVSAIVEFGKIDAVGHSCIIAALLVVAADDARVPERRWKIALTPVAYGALLAAFFALYYVGHAQLYPALPLI